MADAVLNQVNSSADTANYLEGTLRKVWLRFVQSYHEAVECQAQVSSNTERSGKFSKRQQ